MPGKLGFLSAFLIPLLVVTGFYLGDWWNYSVFAFVFLLIPIADALVGLDTRNQPEHLKSEVAEDFGYRLITFVWVPLQFGFLFWAIQQLATNPKMNFVEYSGLLVGTGMVTGGIGITVAHELGHKNNKLEQLLSQALLVTVCYTHFYIEHNRGHHVQVATPEDPATARKGENFFAFFIRSVVMGWIHAWHLEKERLIRKEQSVFGLRNRMIHYIILPILFCLSLCLFAAYVNPTVSWSSVILFFIGQSIIGFGLLELVNYVEHYGITRKKLPNGSYERVNPLHSWNTAYLISNLFLFQLQRHSDHHTYASKRYQVLDHSDESPQLPYGYPTMILMALIPPIWFSVMDKKLEEWKNQLPLLA